jgi:hypothetical protein
MIIYKNFYRNYLGLKPAIPVLESSMVTCVLYCTAPNLGSNPAKGSIAWRGSDVNTSWCCLVGYPPSLAVARLI